MPEIIVQTSVERKLTATFTEQNLANLIRLHIAEQFAQELQIPVNKVIEEIEVIFASSFGGPSDARASFTYSVPDA